MSLMAPTLSLSSVLVEVGFAGVTGEKNPLLSEWNHFWVNECWIQKDDDVHGVSRRWKSWSLPSNHWLYWLVQLENEPCQWLYLGLNRATVLASRICWASGDYNSDIFWSSSVSCLVKSCGKPARKFPMFNRKFTASKWSIVNAYRQPVGASLHSTTHSGENPLASKKIPSSVAC